MNSGRKAIRFHADSRSAIQGFPADSRREAGQQLVRFQEGLNPAESQTVRTIGPGVREIEIQNRGKSHVIYLVGALDAIHVLHAFERRGESAEAAISVALRSLNEVLAEGLGTRGT